MIDQECSRAARAYALDESMIQRARDIHAVHRFARNQHGPNWAMCRKDPQVMRARSSRDLAAENRLSELFEENPSNKLAFDIWQISRGWAPKTAHKFHGIWMKLQAEDANQNSMDAPAFGQSGVENKNISDLNSLLFEQVISHELRNMENTQSDSKGFDPIADRQGSLMSQTHTGKNQDE